MAIKIENRSNDDIIISFMGQSIELADGEDASFENGDKGTYCLDVQRKRIPRESPEEKTKKKFSIYEEDSKPASHVQLKSSVEFETISSKSVITIEENADLIDTLHEDVLFAGYKAAVSGAKILSKKDSFANDEVKKAYVSKQIKGAVFPVGLVGIAITIVGLYCLVSALNGNLIKIFENEVTKSSAVLVSVGGVAVVGVFVSNMIKIFKRVKELS